MDILLLRRSLRKNSFLHQLFLPRIYLNRLRLCAMLQILPLVFLGQRIDNKKYVIYYSSRTLNDAQLNYTTTKKEFLVVVFASEKFQPYLLGSKITIFTNHFALGTSCLRRMSRPDSFAISSFKNLFSRFEKKSA